MRIEVFVLLFVYYINITSATSAGESRSGWSGYTYYPELKGWLKLHTEPTDYNDARIRCHLEDALIATEWNTDFTKALVGFMSSIRAGDQNEPAMYTGAQKSVSDGVQYSYLNGEFILNLGNSAGLESCSVFFANGTSGEIDCLERLPFACFAPVALCGPHESSSGYHFSNVTGHCYKYYATEMYWTEGYEACRRDGAYLAIVNSEAEGQELKNLIGNGYAFIGIYYWAPAGSWLTVQGQTVEEAALSTWELKKKVEGDRTAMIYTNGQIYIGNFDTKWSFICEKHPVLTLNSEKKKLSNVR